MSEILMDPIGKIHSPYKTSKDIPIQGRFKDDVEAFLELKKEYVKGLKDLDMFSHCILIYYFHKSTKITIVGKPFLEDDEHGIFAIRSPHRPNHIGFSVVKIQRIKGNKLYFTQVDMIDGTPLLDIKPYVRFFDSREVVISGWLEKHFKNGEIPDKTIIK
ncbi:MAG: tRNA (N6-threonylcarbamoyladenosine(37)-N6)-methyltransferase TrmO [Candidatus Thermoplasmatota archaeon]|nr:tRNA (N6-threonylcarbamoyladenosine(37)-N6)-methyltransferase TrmO [Candidatus Thermoplasmatota archaeon]